MKQVGTRAQARRRPMGAAIPSHTTTQPNPPEAAGTRHATHHYNSKETEHSHAACRAPDRLGERADRWLGSATVCAVVCAVDLVHFERLGDALRFAAAREVRAMDRRRVPPDEHRHTEPCNTKTPYTAAGVAPTAAACRLRKRARCATPRPSMQPTSSTAQHSIAQHAAAARGNPIRVEQGWADLPARVLAGEVERAADRLRERVDVARARSRRDVRVRAERVRVDRPPVSAPVPLCTRTLSGAALLA